VSGAHDLTPQQAAVLYELYNYREQVAHLQDRPLFKVMGNQTLVALAQACPTSLDDLRGLPGMSHHQVRYHGRAILQAVQRGLAAEPLYPPRLPRPDERYLARLEALREWRKLKARELGVESDIVLPRDLLYSLAGENPRQPQELQAVLHDSPWRLEHFGGQIMEVLSGKR
jgi:ribonuclease D